MWLALKKTANANVPKIVKKAVINANAHIALWKSLRGFFKRLIYGAANSAPDIAKIRSPVVEK